MPELPEVAIALDLKGRLADRAIVKIHIAAFSASRRSTCRCPRSRARWSTTSRDTASSSTSTPPDCVPRAYLARAGWIRWRDEVLPVPPKPSNKSPLAVRVVLDNQPGRHHRGGHQEEPRDVRRARTVRRARHRQPGPDLDDAFTIDVLRGILEREGRKQLKGVLRHCGTIAGIGNAYSDELLHAARMSPFKPANSLDDTELQTLYDAIRTVIGDAVERLPRPARERAEGREEVAPRRPRPDRQALPWSAATSSGRSFADSSLSTVRPARLREATRGPPALQAPEVTTT